MLTPPHSLLITPYSSPLSFNFSKTLQPPYFEGIENNTQILELLTHFLDNKLSSGLYLALDNLTEENPAGILTGAEQKECASFKSKQRRQEYISARLLIKKLGGYAGLDPDSIAIRKEECGKPFGWYKKEHLFIGIAHTDTKILCAMSEKTDIGIDLEPADRPVDERLLSRILHAEERPPEQVELIRLWTIKEAAVKLLGSGLRTNLNEFIVKKESDTRFATKFNDDKTAGICSFKHKGYWISVAYFI